MNKISKVSKSKNITMNDVVGAPNKPGPIYKENMDGTIIPVKKVLDAEGKVVSSSSEVSELDKYIDTTKEYNRLVPKLDPRFSEEFEMIGNKVLVRFFNESLNSKGLILTSVPYITVPKKSGTGTDRIPKRYPFVNVGIVVNISEATSQNLGVKVGDYISVDESIITERPQGGGQFTYIPNMFFHYREKQIEKDSHKYGYVIVDHYNIIAKVTQDSVNQYIA